VLFHTNNILDVLLARAPHVAPATALLDRVAAKTLDGLLGATTLTTIHYLATKAVGARAAQGHIRTLLGLFDVAPVTRAVLTDALISISPITRTLCCTKRRDTRAPRQS
jgi:hypothetical protein